MKRKISLITILILFLFACPLFAQDETVTEQAIYINKSVQIRILTTAEDPNNVNNLDVQIYDKTAKMVIQRKTLTPTIELNKPGDDSDDSMTFIFNLDKELNSQNEYEARILSAGFLLKSVGLNRLTSEFSSTKDFSNCDGIPLHLNGLEDDSRYPNVATNFWKPILSYLTQGNLKNNITAKTGFGDKEEPLELKSVQLIHDDLGYIASRGNVFLCLELAKKPSFETFNISVKFASPPYNLGDKFIGKNLSWSGAAALSRSVDLPKEPEKREVDKNLDLGLSFTSAIKKVSTTNQRKRETHSILDVRFAPILNTIKYKGGPWIKRWTPIFINANVATGKITENTLSLNRVIIGSKAEFRYIPKLRSPSSGETSDTRINSIDYYRINVSGNHSSDRDFKQKEITGKFEFQPVWAILNQLRDTQWVYVKDKITGKRVKKYDTFGWEIIPKVGFEFGKTYSRRDPAEAIKASDFVKRLYGGLEMKFDITSHFSLSIEDTLYGRYELKENRLKNYFKGEVFAPLSNPFKNTSNGLFLSFEKGDAPPFTSTVNVVKFGYRIQSTGWGNSQL